MRRGRSPAPIVTDLEPAAAGLAQQFGGTCVLSASKLLVDVSYLLSRDGPAVFSCRRRVK